MRRTGLGLLALALALGIVRLYTGVVYLADVPLAALVVKRAPDLAIERTETVARPLAHDIVLDEEEPQLFYGRLYVAAMQAVPAAILFLVVVSAMLLFRRARRA